MAPSAGPRALPALPPTLRASAAFTSLPTAQGNDQSASAASGVVCAGTHPKEDRDGAADPGRRMNGSNPETDSVIADLQRRLTAAISENEELRVHLNAAERNAAHESKQHRNVQAEMDNLYAAANEQIGRFQEQAQADLAANQELSMELQNVHVEAHNWHENWRELSAPKCGDLPGGYKPQNTLDFLNAQITRLQDELCHRSEAHHETDVTLFNEREAAGATAEQQTRTIKHLRQTVKQMEDELRGYHDGHADLLTKLEASAGAGHAEQLNAVRERSRTTQAAICEARAHTLEMEKEYEGELRSQRETITQLRAESAVKTRMYADKAAELRDTAGTHTRLEFAMHEFEDLYAAERNNAADLRREVARLEGEIAALLALDPDERHTRAMAERADIITRQCTRIVGLETDLAKLEQQLQRLNKACGWRQAGLARDYQLARREARRLDRRLQDALEALALASPTSSGFGLDADVARGGPVAEPMTPTVPRPLPAVQSTTSTSSPPVGPATYGLPRPSPPADGLFPPATPSSALPLPSFVTNPFTTSSPPDVPPAGPSTPPPPTAEAKGKSRAPPRAPSVDSQPELNYYHPVDVNDARWQEQAAHWLEFQDNTVRVTRMIWEAMVADDVAREHRAYPPPSKLPPMSGPPPGPPPPGPPPPGPPPPPS